MQPVRVAPEEVRRAYQHCAVQRHAEARLPLQRTLLSGERGETRALRCRGEAFEHRAQLRALRVRAVLYAQLGGHTPADGAPFKAARARQQNVEAFGAEVPAREQPVRHDAEVRASPAALDYPVRVAPLPVNHAVGRGTPREQRVGRGRNAPELRGAHDLQPKLRALGGGRVLGVLRDALVVLVQICVFVAEPALYYRAE